MGNKQDITKPGIRWCLTDGWGDCESRVEPWHRAKSFQTACRAIGRIASKLYREFRKVWTFSRTDRGVVCDFGSHSHFGFIENVKFPEVETSPEGASDNCLPSSGKPSEEVSAGEYLGCEDGRRLSDLFEKYFAEARAHAASWWQTHALEYCCMNEWWTMFREGDPDIGVIWKLDLSPSDIFEHVRHWASDGGDAACILAATYTFQRDIEFRAAFTYGEE